MLSYRHAFHAGNFADVLKHTVLSQVLIYMGAKQKGYSYIDTHASAGMYQLRDEKAKKTAEYLKGIALLWQRDDLPAALQGYIEYIQTLNKNGHLLVYPGSPSIAEHFMRRQDAAFLYDLHPSDVNLLKAHMADKRKFQVFKSDGYNAHKAHLPPATRRAVLLIDPPYEIKTDYHQAVKAIVESYQRFDSGSYLLWYPVVNRPLVDAMERQICDSGIKNVLQVEFNIAPDTDQHGMTGSGLFVVNPPWTLSDSLATALPYLVKQLAPESGFYRLAQLINE